MRTIRQLTRLGMAVAGLTLAAGTADAQIRAYRASMDGPSEAPPNASPGTGWSLVTFDLTANTMRVQASFSGLLGATTAAHIHGPTAVPLTGTANVMTQTPSFAGFPLGVTSGSMDQTFNLLLASTYRAQFLAANGNDPAAAAAALFAAVDQERAYFNIHTVQFPGGEIRGFLTAVPEPSTYLLMATGLLGVAGMARRRRTS